MASAAAQFRNDGWNHVVGLSGGRRWIGRQVTDNLHRVLLYSTSKEEQKAGWFGNGRGVAPFSNAIATTCARIEAINLASPVFRAPFLQACPLEMVSQRAFRAGIYRLPAKGAELFAFRFGQRLSFS